MEKIAGVIDMDGFVLDKTFYCKELGVLKLGEDEGRSFFFDIGVHWHHSNSQAAKTLHVSHKKHPQATIWRFSGN